MQPAKHRPTIETAATPHSAIVGLVLRIVTIACASVMFPHMTVADNIGITPQAAGLAGCGNRRAGRRVARPGAARRRSIAIASRMNCRAAQRQRVGVARALAAKPRIVLMDEPFGALDPLTRDALGEDYRELHRKLGLTTVMITHDMTEAILLADRIAVMRGGQIAGARHAGGACRAAATPTSANCCARRAGRPSACTRCCRGTARHELLPIRAGARRLRICPTISATTCASASRRSRSGLRSACRWRCGAQQPAAARRTARPRQHRADRAGPGAAGAVLSAAAGAGGAVAAWFGVGFSAFGFLPAVLALALYQHAAGAAKHDHGLAGRRSAILEAAQGVGMTPRQSLFMVELPLALPVMMAGIRTAAVWVIGTATLSTPIGQTSLGNYIFAGLQTQNWVFVLFGCLAAAALALAVDQLLALIENGLRNRSRCAARSAARHRGAGRRHAGAAPWRARSRATSSAPRPSPNNTCCRH